MENTKSSCKVLYNRYILVNSFNTKFYNLAFLWSCMWHHTINTSVAPFFVMPRLCSGHSCSIIMLSTLLVCCHTISLSIRSWAFWQKNRHYIVDNKKQLWLKATCKRYHTQLVTTRDGHAREQLQSGFCRACARLKTRARV